MSTQPEPELEPEPEPQTTPPPAAPTSNGLTAGNIAAAFAALAPTILAPIQASLAELKHENHALRDELQELRDAQTGKASAAEPEPEVFYCPHYPAENPHPPRAPTDSLKPGFYDLRGDVTADTFSKNASGDQAKLSAHYHEYQTLQCACSYLKSALLHLALILPRLISRIEASPTATLDDGTEVTGQDDADHLACVYATFDQVYAGLLNKRVQFLQLRSLLTPNGGGVPNAKKGLLQVFSNMLYGAFGAGSSLPLNLDSAFKSAISKWETQTSASLLKQAAIAESKSGSYAAAVKTPNKAARPAGRQPAAQKKKK